MIKGLSPDEVANLIANTRTRNQYGPKLGEFVQSDEAAVMVTDTWPEFAAKSASTLYQGFRTAAEKANLTDTISVRQHDDKVYILNMAKIALATNTLNEAASDSVVDSNEDETDSPDED